MGQTENQFNQQLCAFLDASPTPFHAVSSMVALLSAAGFSELSDDQSCLLYTSPSPRDGLLSRMPSSA